MESTKLKRVAWKSLVKNREFSHMWKDDSIITNYLRHDKSEFDHDGNFILEGPEHFINIKASREKVVGVLDDSIIEQFD
jgi:hypothetical protein